MSGGLSSAIENFITFDMVRGFSSNPDHHDVQVGDIMSMPYKIIICDCCDYEGTSTVMWGIFKYVLDDKTVIYINRDLGWCLDCRSVSAVEVLPEAGAVQIDLDLCLSSLNDENAAILGFVGRLLSEKRSRKHKNLLEKKRELENLLRLLNLRKSSPRCLKCSSKRILTMNVPKDLGEEFKYQLNFRHPDCGGHLWIEDSGGLRIAIRMKERFYDIEGRFIESRDGVSLF